MPRNLTQYVQTGQPAAQGSGGTPTPSFSDEVAALNQVIKLLSPPSPLQGYPNTQALSSDGATALLNPFPSNALAWTILNLSAQPVYYWYSVSTPFSVAPAGSMQLNSGAFRAYGTLPQVLYVARTAGDATAKVTLELFG